MKVVSSWFEFSLENQTLYPYDILDSVTAAFEKVIAFLALVAQFLLTEAHVLDLLSYSTTTI